MVRPCSIGGQEPVSWWDVTAVQSELGLKYPCERWSRGSRCRGQASSSAQLLAAMETYDTPIDSRGLATPYIHLRT